MTAKLPRLTGKEMVRFLTRRGFVVVRVRGSHHVMRHAQQRTVIPVHGNQPLKTGTLRSILRDVKISPHEFNRLWEK